MPDRIGLGRRVLRRNCLSAQPDGVGWVQIGDGGANCKTSIRRFDSDRRLFAAQQPRRGWSVWMIPSWAIGTAFVVCVVACAQVVVRRLIGSTDKSAGRTLTEPDVARFTQALEDVQRKLGELEERVDFAERLLAKGRVG